MFNIIYGIYSNQTFISDINKIIKYALKMEKFLYLSHPVWCIITGPSECGKSVFLTNLILNIINKYDKIYIYSPSLHQDLH